MRIGEREGVRCEAAGCQRRTRERKPFCLKHVSEMPYVRSVLDELARQAEEHRLVAALGPRAVDLDGETAQQVLGIVRDRAGRATAQRVAIDAGLPVPTAAAYLDALAAAGLIVLRPTRRGRPLQAVAADAA